MRLRLALLTIWGGAAPLARDADTAVVGDDVSRLDLGMGFGVIGTVDHLAARQVRLEDGKKDCGENRDNGDDNKQFDQSESTTG